MNIAGRQWKKEEVPVFHLHPYKEKLAITSAWQNLPCPSRIIRETVGNCPQNSAGAHV